MRLQEPKKTQESGNCFHNKIKTPHENKIVFDQFFLICAPKTGRLISIEMADASAAPANNPSVLLPFGKFHFLM